MTGKQTDENPFAASAVPSKDGKKSNAPKTIEIGASLFLDGSLLLLASLAAIAIRFRVASVAQLVAAISSALQVPFVLTAAGLVGIATFGGYSATHLKRSFPPTLGIVLFGALLGVAAMSSWFRVIAPIPRSLLMMHILFGVFFVGAARSLRFAFSRLRVK